MSFTILPNNNYLYLALFVFSANKDYVVKYT